MIMRETVLAVLAVVLFTSAFSIFAAKKFKNKDYNPDPTIRSTSIKILNFTGYENLNAITSASCQVLHLKNIQIVLIPIVDEEEQMTYYGYVQKMDGYYLIKIHPNVTEDLLIEIIAHECYHVKDYESGILEKLDYGVRYYDKVYPWSSYYFDREYELRAFEHELDLKLQVLHKMNNPL